MKGIKKTLMAGALACGAAFNAHAELSPLSYGVKGGLSASPYVGYTDGTQIGGKAVCHRIMDTPFVFGNLYVEYAFTDYLGIEFSPGYIKQGATLTAEKKEEQGAASTKENDAESSISIASHSVAIPLHLCVYLLGREEGEDILKVKLGGSAYIPFGTIYTQNNTEVELTDDQKKEKTNFDIAANLALEYEFAFGLSLEAKYSWGFMNRFNLEKEKKQTIFSDTTGLKDLTIHTGTLGVGYNLASLFSE